MRRWAGQSHPLTNHSCQILPGMYSVVDPMAERGVVLEGIQLRIQEGGQDLQILE